MRNQSSKVQLARVASRQWGRVTWAQIRALGIDGAGVAYWLKQGYLHRCLPGVYAVGHNSGGIEADLATALLYAGPGAMLSHASAAWWLGLLDQQPRVIEVSTLRQYRSQQGVKVHQRRTCERVWHRGFPVTTLPQTFLDLAAQAPLRTVRRALAKADYTGILDVRSVEVHLGSGRPGSGKLRHALAEHEPRLALTKSHLEVLFLELCEAAKLPPPDINVYLHGWEIDALWRQPPVAVELDGYANHHSIAQVKRDRRKDLALRALGYTPLRYSEEQLTQHREAVIADLRRSRARLNAGPPPL